MSPTNNVAPHGETLPPFSHRHIGPDEAQIRKMVEELGYSSLAELLQAAAPENIQMEKPLDLPHGLSEQELLLRAWSLAQKNKISKSYIGQGYYDTHTPTVVLRNVLENPGWYTAYTPYQAEISQGRMEALLNFQTMVMELTAMDIANASLLDEGTAAAEAMSLCLSVSRKKGANKIFVSENCFAQTREVMATRAEPLGIEIVTGDPQKAEFDDSYFAALIQYPGGTGSVFDPSDFVAKAKKENILVIAVADLLSLCLLKPPGEWGADVVVGSSQRFGVPMGFGGPHAAYLATRDEFKRQIPGRIIGVSKDVEGHPALRLALQTREQHIRRERATSNICTAQVLLAVMASMYAVYHGPRGLRQIAQKTHDLTRATAKALSNAGFELEHTSYFDTLRIKVSDADTIVKRGHAKGLNLWMVNSTTLSLSFDETKTWADVEELVSVITGKTVTESAEDWLQRADGAIPQTLVRESEYLTQKVFNKHHSETEMLRYIRSLETKDLSLTHSMIPLGSCTMKLNATSEMIPVTWPEFASIHPFAPLDQAQGYLEMIHQLESWLCEITGFAGVSLQPNAGSQGEYAGLLVIRRYHQSRGQEQRSICLIPSSAHGTNPASAVMAGMKVVVVRCDDEGNIDMTDLRAKAEKHSAELSALMITYPSTHGVFEETIREICELIHNHGGQVYMDGANMNALVGVSQPGQIGADVAHLNLHKTFCIPHGGGGPGIGPIGVAAHLKNFLPKHSVVPECGPKEGISAISAAPWGSAGILPISWAYIAMMGRHGLRRATEVAILNANYVAKKLEPHYPVLYKGSNGRVAHECIIDLRAFKDSAGITVDDIAKRLMDFGFHSPTMSWPVAGTLMIEPTESESLEELDRFCEAMITIRKEIAAIEKGEIDSEDNPLRNAPHPVARLLKAEWSHPYSREQAAYPLPWVKEHKFWVSVGRVDNAFGDKNLVCSCLPLEEYES